MNNKLAGEIFVDKNNDYELIKVLGENNVEDSVLILFINPKSDKFKKSFNIDKGDLLTYYKPINTMLKEFKEKMIKQTPSIKEKTKEEYTMESIKKFVNSLKKEFPEMKIVEYIPDDLNYAEDDNENITGKVFVHKDNYNEVVKIENDYGLFIIGSLLNKNSKKIFQREDFFNQFLPLTSNKSKVEEKVDDEFYVIPTNLPGFEEGVLSFPNQFYDLMDSNIENTSISQLDFDIDYKSSKEVVEEIHKDLTYKYFNIIEEILIDYMKEITDSFLEEQSLTNELLYVDYSMVPCYIPQNALPEDLQINILNKPKTYEKIFKSKGYELELNKNMTSFNILFDTNDNKIKELYDDVASGKIEYISSKIMESYQQLFHILGTDISSKVFYIEFDETQEEINSNELSQIANKFNIDEEYIEEIMDL